MRLLQVSWAEILTLMLAFRSIPFTGRLYFASDFWLDERSAKECGATELFNHVSSLRDDHQLLLMLFLSISVHSNNTATGEDFRQQGGILFIESFNIVKL